MSNDGDDGLERLAMEPRGRDFALIHTRQDGTRSEMPLNRGSLIRLSSLVSRTLAFDIEREASPTMDQQGIQWTAAIPVDRFDVKTNLLQTAILVHFLDTFGAEHSFSLPPSVALVTAKLLIRHVQDLSASTSAGSGN